MSSRPPSVDALARSLSGTGLPHPLLVDVARRAIAAGDHELAPRMADELARTLLQPVVNATGVLLHTNMGRAPWSTSVSSRYSNLELDLESGQRGSRQSHVGHLFARLCDAEAAMVVNNCASAVLLAMAALAAGRGAAVSRGELVEIGGSFRVPDVMSQSGARLVEVGTTNRTRRSDYETAIEESAGEMALVLKVHQSNYKITGFTEDTSVADLTGLGVPVVADIGSGLLDAACPWLENGPPTWLAGEPAAKQSLAAGADLVTFSGDKLLGGPQAGIIAGRADLVSACGSHPLARALRPGGLVLSSLQELAMAYLRRDGNLIPFWKMASFSKTQLRDRAEALGVGEVVDLDAVPGGGTLPGVTIPSVGIALASDHSDALRRPTDGTPPVIARVSEGQTHLDLRTVDPEQDDLITSAIERVLR
ncbi:MAG: L-seryl-tRNA(Sec) selenium transferase [Acidimicrobiales bacterium]